MRALAIEEQARGQAIGQLLEGQHPIATVVFNWTAARSTRRMAIALADLFLFIGVFSLFPIDSLSFLFWVNLYTFLRIQPTRPLKVWHAAKSFEAFQPLLRVRKRVDLRAASCCVRGRPVRREGPGLQAGCFVSFFCAWLIKMFRSSKLGSPTHKHISSTLRLKNP
jgi:hypothetical protein